MGNPVELCYEEGLKHLNPCLRKRWLRALTCISTGPLCSLLKEANWGCGEATAGGSTTALQMSQRDAGEVLCTHGHTDSVWQSHGSSQALRSRDISKPKYCTGGKITYCVYLCPFGQVGWSNRTVSLQAWIISIQEIISWQIRIYFHIKIIFLILISWKMKLTPARTHT